MADKCQAGTVPREIRIQQPTAISLWPGLWTISAQHYAETGANTRLPASDPFSGLVPFTSRRLNHIRPLPPFVRNAEVGSPSLLASDSYLTPPVISQV